LTKPSLPILLLSSLLAFATLVPHEAVAQAGSTEDEAARLTFLSAREAFVAGDYETALQRFRQAYQLSQRPGLLYNIAQTLDRLRRDQETVDALRRYLQAAPDAQNRAEVEARIRVLDTAIGERRARGEDTNGGVTPRSSGSDPLAIMHPAIFISAAGLALVTGGLSIWTGLETVSLNDDYLTATDYNSALALYNDAETYQILTNVFIFSAGIFGVAAVVFAVITDWGQLTGSAEAGELRPTLAADPNGGQVGLTGWF
jgi:tetratricopeptide (TPR) repeat protein